MSSQSLQAKVKPQLPEHLFVCWKTSDNKKEKSGFLLTFLLSLKVTLSAMELPS